MCIAQNWQKDYKATLTNTSVAQIIHKIDPDLTTFQEKEAELELMRKGRKEQRDFFKKMESGQIDEKPTFSKERRLVRNIKDVRTLRHLGWKCFCSLTVIIG